VAAKARNLLQARQAAPAVAGRKPWWRRGCSKPTANNEGQWNTYTSRRYIHLRRCQSSTLELAIEIWLASTVELAMEDETIKEELSMEEHKKEEAAAKEGAGRTMSGGNVVSARDYELAKLPELCEISQVLKY